MERRRQKLLRILEVNDKTEKTLLNLIKETDKYSTFLSLLNDDLKLILDDENIQYTLIIPNNRAFERFLKVNSSLELTPELIKSILNDHIILEKVDLTTLEKNQSVTYKNANDIKLRFFKDNCKNYQLFFGKNNSSNMLESQLIKTKNGHIYTSAKVLMEMDRTNGAPIDTSNTLVRMKDKLRSFLNIWDKKISSIDPSKIPLIEPTIIPSLPVEGEQTGVSRGESLDDQKVLMRDNELDELVERFLDLPQQVLPYPELKRELKNNKNFKVFRRFFLRIFDLIGFNLFMDNSKIPVMINSEDTSKPNTDVGEPAKPEDNTEKAPKENDGDQVKPEDNTEKAPEENEGDQAKPEDNTEKAPKENTDTNNNQETDRNVDRNDKINNIVGNSVDDIIKDLELVKEIIQKKL